jgi:hypothetical protein
MEINLETKRDIKNIVLFLNTDSNILSHTLLISSYNINSLTIRKGAEIDKNRVLYVNSPTYDISTNLLTWEEIKYAYDNQYFVKLSVSTHGIESPLLRISNCNIDQEFNEKYNLTLEEI